MTSGATEPLEQSTNRFERLWRQWCIDELNQRYADCIDEGRLDDWVSLFHEDGRYRVQSRENRDRGLPLSLISCHGRPMLQDRVLVITKVMVYAPRTVSHVLAPARIVGGDGDRIRARARFAMFHTLPNEPTQLLAVGHYEDLICELESGSPRFQERTAVYDSLLIPNSMVYPI